MEHNIHYDEVNSVYDSVKQLYLEYCEKLNNEKKRLELLNNDIREIKDYIKYLQEYHNSDSFVFSPRGVISKTTGKKQEGVYDTGKIIDFTDAEKKEQELEYLENNKISIEEKIKQLEKNIFLLEQNKKILKEVTTLKERYDNEKAVYEEEQKHAIDKYVEKREKLQKCLKDGPIEKLSYLSHMIDMVNSFIDNDPVRAKLELMKIKDNLQYVSKDLEEIAKVPEEGDNLL